MWVLAAFDLLIPTLLLDVLIMTAAYVALTQTAILE
jgi:hypothetical protein